MCVTYDAVVFRGYSGHFKVLCVMLQTHSNPYLRVENSKPRKILNFDENRLILQHFPLNHCETMNGAETLKCPE